MSIKQTRIYSLQAESKNFSLSPYSRRFSWGDEEIEKFFDKLDNVFKSDTELFLGSLLLYEERGEYKILDGGHRIAILGAILEELEGTKQFNGLIKGIKEDVKNRLKKVKKPKEFANFIKTKIIFALTELESQSDFSTILLKSHKIKQQLQKSDILKARLLSKSIHKQENARVWEECKKKSGVIGFPYFLLYTLALLKKDIEIEKSKMLEIFEKNLSLEVDKFFEMMKRLKSFFENYIPQKEGEWRLEGKSKEYITLLSYLLVAQSHKCWLREFASFAIEKNPSEEECISYLERLDSFLALVRYKGGGLKERIRAVKNYQDKFEFEVPKKWEILNQGEETTHYWFIRLEYYLYKHRSKYAHLQIGIKSFKEIAEKYIFESRDLSSVEHIWPQSKKREGDWSGKTQENRGKIHCFGNLALISKSFNSSLNNRSIKDKKEQILKQITKGKTLSLKMLLVYALIEENKGRWSYELAMHHQKQMIEILQDSFKQ